MSKSLIEQYNLGQQIERRRWHHECMRYYRQCILRLRLGERFFPYGMTESSYESMVIDLCISTGRLMKSGAGEYSYNAAYCHFSLLHEQHWVWDVDWSKPVYFFETNLLTCIFKIHEVVRLEEKHVNKRKVRFVYDAEGNEFQLPDSKVLYSLRVTTLPGKERLIPADKVPPNWRAILNHNIGVYLGGLKIGDHH